MDERESNLVPERVVTPDFVDVDLVVLAQSAGHLDHRRRHVQVKRRPHAREVRPLSERLEVVHRLTCFYLDDNLEASAPLLRLEHEIRVQRRRSIADGRVLFGTGVDANVEFATAFRLKQANNAVVLELFADRPHQDRTHQRLRRSRNDDLKTPHSNMSRLTSTRTPPVSAHRTTRAVPSVC